MAEGNRLIQEVKNLEADDSSLGDFWYGGVTSDSLAAGAGSEQYNLDDTWATGGSSLAIVDGALTVMEDGIYAVIASGEPAHTTSQLVRFVLSFNGDFSDYTSPYTLRDYTDYAGSFGWSTSTVSTAVTMKTGTVIKATLARVGNTDPAVVCAGVELSVTRIA